MKVINLSLSFTLECLSPYLSYCLLGNCVPDEVRWVKL